jgi:uncharacterized protein (TIGR02466 family)
MTQINMAFAVPLVTSQLEDYASLNEELRSLFLKLEQQGDKYRNPEPFVVRNKPLFESKFTLFDWQYDSVRKLRDFCYAALYGVIRELNGYQTDELKRLHIACESWFHITRRGGYFGAHCHPMHSWSGVYCVKHEDDDPNSDSGLLSFIHPNVAARAYIDMATSRMGSPFSLGDHRMRLKPGQLVLFPSWILHEVLPYEGDSERITVAFNARFRMEGVTSLHNV